MEILIIFACFLGFACGSGFSVNKEKDYIIVERFAVSDSVVFYYSIYYTKLLCVEEFFNGNVESFYMDREYSDLKTKSKVGDYIYKSYLYMYPGFKMIY